MVRELTRQLGNGAHVRVTREWDVRFIPDGGAYRVAGEQANVTVEVPPGLEALAEVEQARKETGPLGHRLNTAGMIIGGQSQSASEAFAVALEMARGIVAERRMPGASALSQLQQSLDGAIAPLPVDLFAPARSHWTENRVMSLPDGGTGQIAIAYSATRHANSGVMATTRRELTSKVGESSRATLERWTLT